MMLMEGLDAIKLTLKRKDQIVVFRDRNRARRPWIYFDAGAVAEPAEIMS